jgi:hypothetical protein
MKVLASLLLVAAGGLYVMLPPSAVVFSSDRTVRGVVHVHTRRSDGTGTVQDVARAAGRAGLSFVVITDHGDGTAVREAPQYIDGVLVIDAVEISTDDGHLVAIGLPEVPYPLAGEARDVADDVHRLGGWVVAAHPGSPKEDLAWRDWEVPFDGLEWLNGDSEWRDERVPSLLRVLLTYPFRPRETLGTLLDRPGPVLERWDALTATRRVVGLAAADAHARVGLTALGEPYDSRVSLPLPSYEAVFSALSIVLDDVELTSDPARDAVTVEQALRAGHLHSVVDALGVGGALSFSASSGGVEAREGESLAASGPVSIRIRCSALSGVRIVLYRNGRPVNTAEGGRLEDEVPPERAVYRVEVLLDRPGGQPSVPWIVSNPIYVNPAPALEASGPPAAASARAFDPKTLATARVEQRASSSGATSVTAVPGGRELLFRYALGGRPSESPFVAAVLSWPNGVSASSSLRFRARADRPLRFSVQLREPGGPLGVRWRRSVYLDDADREVLIPLTAMRPLDGVALETRLERITDVLFVVDAVNTALGTAGRIWIGDLELVQ